MVSLSINLNRFALLRNSRPGSLPSLHSAVSIVTGAGAHGITVHPRPDERHITRDDVALLDEFIAGHNRTLGADATPLEFNIEGYPSPDFLNMVIARKPHQCTLVPDLPDQATSDHGWDVHASEGVLIAAIDRLKAAGVRVALFVDPDIAVIDAAVEVGADRIELYTESYANAWGTDAFEDSLALFAQCSSHATAAGLGVNAGHDLNLDNLPAFSRIPGLLECSIGHAVACDALFVGIERAVTLYGQAIDGNDVPHDWYPGR